MGEKPLGGVEIKQFAGLVSNLDPHDIEPGQAQVQVNAVCVRMGELSIRRGLRGLVFDNEDF